MRRQDYDAELHRNYATGRALSPAARRVWTDVFRAHLEPGADALDVGCGTGRFLDLLVELAGKPVVGIDPSRRMLAHASGPLACARAEALPLRDAGYDFALLSMVTHHFDDPVAACHEVARVLRPGGRALLRTVFGGQLDHIDFYRFFPEAKRVDDSRMPTGARIESWFEEAGFACTSRDRVLQPIAESLAAHLERLRSRSISTFEYLTEDEIERGFAAMEEAARSEREPRTVLDPIEVVVFERR